MQQLNRILCRIGLHKWSQWDSVETPIEATTGHDALDAIDIDGLFVETRTRCCEDCRKGQIKQILRW